MKLLTIKNDTRQHSDEWLINHWANRLYESIVKRDFALRNHLKRQLPRGLVSKILVREAQIAKCARDDSAHKDAMRDAIGDLGQD